MDISPAHRAGLLVVKRNRPAGTVDSLPVQLRLCSGSRVRCRRSAPNPQQFALAINPRQTARALTSSPANRQSPIARGTSSLASCRPVHPVLKIQQTSHVAERRWTLARHIVPGCWLLNGTVPPGRLTSPPLRPCHKNKTVPNFKTVSCHEGDSRRSLNRHVMLFVELEAKRLLQPEQAAMLALALGQNVIGVRTKDAVRRR